MAVLEIDSGSDCELLTDQPKARAKGPPSREAILRHVYRPALPAGPRELPPPPKAQGFKAVKEARQGTGGRSPGLKTLFRLRKEERQAAKAKAACTGPPADVVDNSSTGNGQVLPQQPPATSACRSVSQEVQAEVNGQSLVSLLEGAGVLPSVAMTVVSAAERLAKKRGAAQAMAERRRWRSLVWNLRHNKDLLDKVNSGATSAAELMRMSHEQLAEAEVAKRRRVLQAEALKDVVMHDHSTFAVRCPSCGSEEARGTMTHAGSNLEDDGWGQMSLRGRCMNCGHVWVDGRG